MDDIKIVPRVSIPKVGMQSVRMPIVGNNMDSAIMSIFKDLKSHMIGWYDVKRQGCTNESLADNPVLEDLSDGQYVFDFNEYTNGKSNVVNSRVIKGDCGIPYDKMTSDIESFNIAIKGLSIGRIIYKYRSSDGTEKNAVYNSDGVYTVPKCFKIEGTGSINSFSFNNVNDGVTITMLPTKHPLELKNFVFGGLSGMGTEKYPDSLVFNGTNPTWVYDRDSFTSGDTSSHEWLSNCKLHINKSVFLILNKIESNIGENLNIKNPSYKIRISGLPDGFRIRKYNTFYDKDGWKYAQNSSFYTNGTHIISSYSKELIADENNVCRFYTYYALYDENSEIKDEYPVDITIEFLPNYPAPTTKMYGVIPSLTQGAKCMMMDFVPINEKSTVESQGCCYYSQRVISVDSVNYGIYSYNDTYSNFDKETAYNGRNSNGTFINCVKNNKRITALSLFQKQQVVGVNTQNPANTHPVICASETFKNSAQMALNSQLLFDKELTEEEMKVVMDRIMKYKNVDGIDMLSAPDKIGFTVGEYDGGGG